MQASILTQKEMVLTSDLNKNNFFDGFGFSKIDTFGLNGEEIKGYAFKGLIIGAVLFIVKLLLK